MAINTLRTQAGPRQSLAMTPAAAPQWHAWMRMVALTVIAVGVGLTFGAASAQADTTTAGSTAEQSGSAVSVLHHRAADATGPKLGSTLTSTLTRTTDAVTQTTNTVTKTTDAAIKTTDAAIKTTVADTTATVTKTTHTVTTSISTKDEAISTKDEATSTRGQATAPAAKVAEATKATSTATKPAAATKRTTIRGSAPGPSTARQATSRTTTPVTNTVKLVNDAALKPTAKLVSTVGASRPVEHVLDTTNAVLHASAQPSELVPTVSKTVSLVTPAPLRPVVDRVGAVTTDVTAPATTVVGRTEAAVEPVVPVQKVTKAVSDHVVTPLNHGLGTTVDHTLPRVTSPVAQTVHDVGHATTQVATTVDQVANGHTPVIDAPGQIGKTVTTTLGTVTTTVGTVTTTVGKTVTTTVGAIVHQRPPTSLPHAPVTILIPQPSTPGAGTTPGTHQPRPASSSAPSVAPIRSAPTVSGLTTAHVQQSVPTSVGRAGHLPAATHTAAGPQLLVLPTSASARAANGHSARVTGGNSEAASPSSVSNSGTTISVAQGATGSVSNSPTSAGSAANASGSSAAQTAAVPSTPPVLDLHGSEPMQWQQESGIVRTPYDPGFSPD